MHSIPDNELIDRYGLDYFKDASTLGALTSQALSYLLKNGKIMQLKERELLFSYGDRVDCFYVILDGLISFYKPCETGRCHIRNYGFGTTIGFVAMVGLHNRSGDAVAAEPSCLLKVSAALFSAMQQSFPADFAVLQMNLSREMARRLRESDSKLAAHDIHE